MGSGIAQLFGACADGESIWAGGGGVCDAVQYASGAGGGTGDGGRIETGRSDHVGRRQCVSRARFCGGTASAQTGGKSVWLGQASAAREASKTARGGARGLAVPVGDGGAQSAPAAETDPGTVSACRSVSGQRRTLASTARPGRHQTPPLEQIVNQGETPQ